MIKFTQIDQAPNSHLLVFCHRWRSLIVIIRLILSLYLRLKVITWSDFQCNLVFKLFKYRLPKKQFEYNLWRGVETCWIQNTSSKCLSAVSTLIFPFPFSRPRPGTFIFSSQNPRRKICPLGFAPGIPGRENQDGKTGTGKPRQKTRMGKPRTLFLFLSSFTVFF